MSGHLTLLDRLRGYPELSDGAVDLIVNSIDEIESLQSQLAAAQHRATMAEAALKKRLMDAFTAGWRQCLESGPSIAIRLYAVSHESPEQYADRIIATLPTPAVPAEKEPMTNDQAKAFLAKIQALNLRIDYRPGANVWFIMCQWYKGEEFKTVGKGATLAEALAKAQSNALEQS